jgi:hypothetical protein
MLLTDGAQAYQIAAAPMGGVQVLGLDPAAAFARVPFCDSDPELVADLIAAIMAGAAQAFRENATNGAET